MLRLELIWWLKNHGFVQVQTSYGHQTQTSHPCLFTNHLLHLYHNGGNHMMKQKY